MTALDESRATCSECRGPRPRPDRGTCGAPLCIESARLQIAARKAREAVRAAAGVRSGLFDLRREETEGQGVLLRRQSVQGGTRVSGPAGHVAPSGHRCTACGKLIKPLEPVRRGHSDCSSGPPVVIYRHTDECGSRAVVA